MNPSSDITDDHAPTLPPTEPAAPSFCASCGLPLIQHPCVCASRIAPVLPAAPSLFGSLRFAIGFYFLLLVAVLAHSAFILLQGEDISPRLEIKAMLTYDVTMALITSAVCVIKRRDILPLLRLPTQRRWLGYAAGLSCVTYAIALLVAGAWGLLFDLDHGPVYTGPYIESGTPIFIAFISIALFPGIFEELAFRGVIHSSLVRVLDPREAVLVTSLFFASIHLNALMFVNLFWIGLMLAFLLSRTGSLLPGIVLHFCHNALCVGGELLTGIP